MSTVCSVCGETLAPQQTFCSFCGTAVASAASPQNPSQATAVAPPTNALAVIDPAPVTAAPRQQAAPAPTVIVIPPADAPKEVRRSPALAMVLEIALGIFGLLGIGHIYSGRVGQGVLFLVGWLVLRQLIIAISAPTIILFFLIALPLIFGVPIYSGMRARDYIRLGATATK